MISTRLLEARGGTPALNTLIDNRSDPGVRSVLLDFYLDRGCLPARLGPEEIHRLTLRRCLPCDEEKWEKHCPKPQGLYGAGEEQAA